MTSPQHARWIRSGVQWQLARPLVALRDRLRAYGYTVYDIGNTSHLDHIPPEDHTPYSETGWPGTTPYGWVTAIDVMPPPAGLPSLQQLGAQMVADRQANVPGVAWLKYMNWGPVNNSRAVQDRWTPGHKTISSSDVGHIHASGRSDHVLSATQAELDYDPVARLRSQTTTSSRGDDDMLYTVKGGGDRTGAPAGSDPGAIYVASAMGPRWINGAEWGSLGSPQPMVCDSYARIVELCPAAEVAPAGPVTVEFGGADLEAALGELLRKVVVTGKLDFGS